MTDYSELKRLAERIREGSGLQGMNAEEAMFNFECAATPDAILALIAENERMTTQVRLAGVSAEMTAHDAAGRAASEYLSVALERDQLKADNEALRKQIDDMSPLKGAPLTGPDLKCLACGGYHYGMSGLPCPKMALTAGAAMSQGEQL